MSKRGEPFVQRLNSGDYVHKADGGCNGAGCGYALVIPLLEGEDDWEVNDSPYTRPYSAVIYIMPRPTTPAQQEPEVRHRKDCDHHPDSVPDYSYPLRCSGCDSERGEDRRVSKMADYIRNVPGLCRRTTGERRGA